jgi:hypothetical protein
MAMNSINFFQPGTDAAIDANQIQRQRDMAALLLKQSQQTPQGQMVSGHYVAPSWMEALGNAAKGIGARYIGQQADDKERQMATALMQSRAKEANDFMGALSGTPAKTIQPATPNDDEGNPMPVAQQEAVAPDRNRAMAMALQSQNPMLQSAGGDLMKQQMADQRRQQIMQSAGFGPGGTPIAGGQAGATSDGNAAPGGSAPPAGGAGGLYGLDPRAVALQLSGDPELSKFAQNIIEAQKPQAQREGVVYARQPDGTIKVLLETPKTDANMQLQRGPGGQVTGMAPIPGATGAVGALTSAKANAEQEAASANTMQTIDIPGIGPVTKTRAQWMQQMGGGAAQAPAAAPAPRMAPPAQGGVAPRGGFTGSGEEVMAAIDASPVSPAVKAEMRRAYAAQMSGNNPPFNAMGTGALPPGSGAPGIQTAPGGGIVGQDDADKKFGTQIASQSADALLAGRDKAKAAVDSISTIQQARKSITAGAFQGTGADTKLAIAKFINANVPGVNIDPNKVANTDYLTSTLGAGLLAEAKTLGSNPSNADATRINDIVGSIGKDPRAMDKILDWRQDMAQRVIDNHNSTVQDAETRGMRSPYDLRIKAPASPGAPASGGGFRIIGVQR